MSEQRPLVGYRNWIVQSKRLALLPVSGNGLAWNLDGPTQAECIFVKYAGRLPHPVPFRRCECGLYLRPWIHPSSGEFIVAGAAHAWGHVIEHRGVLANTRASAPRWAPSLEGIRVEWAKPIFFYAPTDRETAVIVAAIAERLGADIVKPSDRFIMDWQEYRELTAKYGTSMNAYFPLPFEGPK